jgi:hypothetical protein
MKLNDTQIDILMTCLRTDIVKVDFTKKDGTARKMLCTLAPHLIPDVHTPKGGNIVTFKDDLLVRVFDVENQGWRSIIFDNVLTFEQ